MPSFAVPNAAVVKPNVQSPTVARSATEPPCTAAWAVLSEAAKAIIAAPRPMKASPRPHVRSVAAAVVPDPSARLVTACVLVAMAASLGCSSGFRLIRTLPTAQPSGLYVPWSVRQRTSVTVTRVTAPQAGCA